MVNGFLTIHPDNRISTTFVLRCANVVVKLDGFRAPLTTGIAHKLPAIGDEAMFPTSKTLRLLRTGIAVLIFALALTGQFTDASAKSDPNAQYNAGVQAYKASDYETAFREWSLAAQQNSVKAQYGLGTLYYDGRGVAQDYQKAIDWVTKAIPRLTQISRNFSISTDVRASADRQLKSAMRIRTSAKQKLNEQKETVRLAADAERKKKEKEARLAAEAERKKKEKEARLIAEANRKKAEVERKRKEEEARIAAEAEWKRKAEETAKKARVAAEAERKRVAEAERKRKEAKEKFIQMAESGDPQAQAQLGNLYYEGKGVEQNYAKAAEWYRKAAEQGDAEAQFALGRLYQVGEGINSNLELAEHWLQLAAQQEHAEAAKQLRTVQLEVIGRKMKQTRELQKQALENNRIAQEEKCRADPKCVQRRQEADRRRESEERAAARAAASAQRAAFARGSVGIICGETVDCTNQQEVKVAFATVARSARAAGKYWQSCAESMSWVVNFRPSDWQRFTSTQKKAATFLYGKIAQCNSNAGLS